MTGCDEWNVTYAPGFGQTVATVNLFSAGGVSSASVYVLEDGLSIAYTPSVYVNASAGQAQLELRPPAPLVVLNFTDPQGLFAPGSASVVDGSVIGNVSQSAAVGSYLVVALVSTGLSATQFVQFKLAVSPPPPPPPVPSPSPDAAWAYVPVAPRFNADMARMFEPGTYLSPRPQTCGVRIGTDGWSAWTFPWWGSPSPPTPDFSNIPALSIGGGAIRTPQGAQFLLNVSTGEPNIAFASIWDNYAPSVNVTVPTSSLPNASAVWVLLAGSTNPMQVRVNLEGIV